MTGTQPPCLWVRARRRQKRGEERTLEERMSSGQDGKRPVAGFRGSRALSGEATPPTSPVAPAGVVSRPRQGASRSHPSCCVAEWGHCHQSRFAATRPFLYVSRATARLTACGAAPLPRQESPRDCGVHSAVTARRDTPHRRTPTRVNILPAL